MKYHQITFPYLSRKISRKFLLIFSVVVLAAGGIAWACSDGGYDDNGFSNFSPESFVAPQYSPFFYSSSTSYYGEQNDNSNTRFNDQILEEWQAYFGGKADKEILKVLLFNTSYAGLDSVSKYMRGELTVPIPNLPDLKQSKLNNRQVERFLSYLLLAKSCEDFTVNEASYSWDEKVVVKVPDVQLETKLLKAFKSNKDPFIKERLWFQLVRYTYFQTLPETTTVGTKGEVAAVFDKYESSFPKNMIYYRALGYVAGYYYKQKDYARANYLYSLCYNFSQETKIPSSWSFHPQNEEDWEKSLALAKNVEEKITLWQMLGIRADESRAISKIYALKPNSEKSELLLSRLINILEIDLSMNYANLDSAAKDNKVIAAQKLISTIAKNNNTAKPYIWNMAAGYLSTKTGDYNAARNFYDQAKSQLPKNDKLLEAQYRILDWTLYLAQLKKIGVKEEAEMVAPLNWLANLRDQKDTVANLRYSMALDYSITTLANLYKKEGKLLKSNCFNSETAFYTSNTHIESLKALLVKVNKSPFEQAMLRYYHLSLDELYYHQGLMMVYQEKTDQAIAYLEKAGEKAQFTLGANPFSIHINDCHDCDFAAPQKTTYNPLTFLKTIKTLKRDITAGKNTYVNTFLLADAYYNITHYGNSRAFYQNAITGYDVTSEEDIPNEFRMIFTSGKLAEKYYLLARTYAKTREQKARCTFMAAKCERNDMYNGVYDEDDETNSNSGYQHYSMDIPYGKYFAELKSQYAQTQYYKEILKECGYFRSYADKH